MLQILCKNRSMQWADYLNIQCCCNLQKILNLCSVFSNNSDIVTACFAIPVFLYIKRSELTESIRREKNLILAIVCYHYLRPMYHRCKYKCKLMFSKCQCIFILHFQLVLVCKFQVTEKVSDHCKCLCISNHLCIRIYFQKFLNIC